MTSEVGNDLVHIHFDNDCSYDEEGFLYTRLPPNTINQLKTRLSDVITNKFNLEVVLSGSSVSEWRKALDNKCTAFHLFRKIKNFFEDIYTIIKYWPDVEYFRDFVILGELGGDVQIRFLRPTKFTTFNKYLVGLRGLFLDMCQQTLRNVLQNGGGLIPINIQTGKGVNIKTCKLGTFIRRPPPFMKRTQEQNCKPGGICAHHEMVQRFATEGRVVNDNLGHCACPATLEDYAENGVTFNCHLFPEARSFFSELGRSDKLHTVFCYPDQLLDRHWYQDFSDIIDQIYNAENSI